jgi:hypothetical protein
MERALLHYIKHWYKQGKKFTWTKSSAQIMDAIAKATTD